MGCIEEQILSIKPRDHFNLVFLTDPAENDVLGHLPPEKNVDPNYTTDTVNRNKRDQAGFSGINEQHDERRKNSSIIEPNFSYLEPDKRVDSFFCISIGTQKKKRSFETLRSLEFFMRNKKTNRDIEIYLRADVSFSSIRARWS